MHILFFEDKPTRFAGGQERSLFEMAERYHKQGVSVSLCYKEEGDFLPDYKKFCKHTFKLESRQIRLNQLLNHLKDLSLLKKLDKQFHFTDFYANQYFDIPFVNLASIVLNKKSTCHLRLPAPPYLSRQYRFFLEKTGKLIAISKHTKKTYLEMGVTNSNFEVVYNIINKPSFIPEKKQFNGIITITYAGRICPEKGSELLLKAFIEVHKKYPNTELRYYGTVRGENTPEDYIDRLKYLAEINHVKEFVHFYPHEAEFSTIAKVTDLFVLPSLWEAFGRIIIEANHYEIPIIATNVGGIPEVMKLIKHEENLCEPSVKSLSAKLKDFINLIEI